MVILPPYHPDLSVTDRNLENCRTYQIDGELQHRGSTSPTLLTRLPAQEPQTDCNLGQVEHLSRICVSQVCFWTRCMRGRQPPARVSCMQFTTPELLSGLVFAHVSLPALLEAGARRTDRPTVLPATVTPNAWKMALHSTMVSFKVRHVDPALHSPMQSACRPVEQQDHGPREGGCASQLSVATPQFPRRYA